MTHKTPTRTARPTSIRRQGPGTVDARPGESTPEPDVFGVFLLYQFFRGIPRDLIEAARLDGASHLRILATIVLPLARGGLVTLAILTMLSEWKELLWPIVVNTSIDKLTLGPGLALLRGTYTTDWNVLMSAGVLAALPMIVIYLILQRHFIASVARSGLR